MKQILVATDFSTSATNAMEYAMALAKTLDTEVCAIHAIHPTEGINNNTYNAIYIEDYYNTKRQALRDWAAQFTIKEEYKDIPVTTLCNVGFLKNVIGQYLEENRVELLVMGVTGSTGITGIVGSNASMLLTRVKTPMLVVPTESKFAKVPSITFATDFETRLSAEDVNALNEMVKAFGSDKMHVLYVEEKDGPRNRELQESRLQDLISGTKLDFNYITKRSTLDGIMEFIDSHEIDLLCLVKHHHNVLYRLFSRSMVHQVINRSVKAVLVLHE